MEAGVDLSPYDCDLIPPESLQPHLRYVEELGDIKKAGCGLVDNAEVHCMKQECRSSVAHTEFENGSMVSHCHNFISFQHHIITS